MNEAMAKQGLILRPRKETRHFTSKSSASRNIRPKDRESFLRPFFGPFHVSIKERRIAFWLFPNASSTDCRCERDSILSLGRGSEGHSQNSKSGLLILEKTL